MSKLLRNPPSAFKGPRRARLLLAAGVWLLGMAQAAWAASPSDPYLWLESAHGARAMSWVKAQDERTLSRLQGDAQYAPDLYGVPAMALDAGTQRMYIGGQTLEIIHAPAAHTDGDLIVRYLEADVLQTGDTFFHGFYPDIDFEHGGTIDGMIAFYDTLYRLCGPHTRVIPGHGPVASRQDIRAYQDMLRQVRERVAHALAQGLTEQQLLATHPLDDLDRSWGGNLVKQPYLLAIVYEDLRSRGVGPPH